MGEARAARTSHRTPLDRFFEQESASQHQSSFQEEHRRAAGGERLHEVGHPVLLLHGHDIIPGAESVEGWLLDRRGMAADFLCGELLQSESSQMYCQ